MGKELLGLHRFRATIGECQKALNNLPDDPDWSIADELARPHDTSNVYKSSFSQPLCTILQIGLVDLFNYWRLGISAVVGHSSGEIAAAYAAGILSLRDAVVAAFYRGKCLSNVSARTNGNRIYGSMCAIGLSKEEAENLLCSYHGCIQLAAVNSPTSCTLSGDANAIKQVVNESKERGLFCRELRVDTGGSIQLLANAY